MRAAVLTDFNGPLEVASLPDLDCPDDGVVLRLLARRVRRLDWHVWTGADPVALPHVPGHEYSGKVVATGPAERRWRAANGGRCSAVAGLASLP